MKKSRIIESTILVTITIVFIFFRIINLRLNPGWYVDEGCILNISSNLLSGKLELFSLPYYFFPRLPLFPLIVAVFIKIFGMDILAVRIPSLLFGLLTGLLLYLTGKELYDKKTGYLAFFLFAIFPFAILSNKIGFSFNLTALLAITTYYFCIKYIKENKNLWLVLACAGAGLSAITEIFGAAIIAAVTIFLLVSERKKALWGLPLMLSPAVIFGLIMLISFKGDFLSQIANFLSFRVINPNPLYQTPGVKGILNLPNLLSTFWLILSYGGLWTLLGSIGFLTVGKTKKERMISLSIFLLLFFSISLAFGKTAIRFTMVMVPFIMLGLSALAFRKWNIPFNKIRVKPKYEKILNQSIPFLLVALLILTSIPHYKNVLNYQSRHVVMYPKDAIIAAEFINSRSKQKGFAIAAAEISWLIKGKTVEIIDVVAFGDRKEVFLFREIYPNSKFTFDASLGRAEYALLNRFISGFHSFFPSVVDVELKIRKNWILEFENNNYVVYKNPEMQ